MEEKNNKKYVIAAAMFVVGARPQSVYNFINFFGLPKVTHNFWRLIDSESGLSVSELHGMAVDSNGKIIPIGYLPGHGIRACVNVREDLLKRTWEPLYGVSSTFIDLPIHGSQVVYEGDDALKQWEKGVSAVSAINELKLTYPPGGIFYYLDSKAVNSNAVYSTFAKIFEIDPYVFPGTHPLGIERDVYSWIKPKLRGEDFNAVDVFSPSLNLNGPK